jgi:hypothetical protein
MVLVLPERSPKPSASSGLARGLSQGIPSLLNELQDRKKRAKEDMLLEKENEAFGLPPGARNPKLRESYLDNLLKAPEKKRENDIEEEGYKTIENSFGKNAADVWKASPVGGRSSIVDFLLKARQANYDIDSLLGPVAKKMQASQGNMPGQESPQQMQSPEGMGVNPAEAGASMIGQNQLPGQKKAEYEYPEVNIPEGIKPSELRDENMKIYQPLGDRIRSKETLDRDIDTLDKINKSKKLPTGISKFLINSDTGDFYSVPKKFGLMNKETQLFVKIISQFANKAKDSFGSRVTNFDLQQFMKQYPDLLNTDEGRDLIIKYIKNTNRINGLYDQALRDTYKHYGLGKIAAEHAEEIAEHKIQDKVAEYRKFFDEEISSQIGKEQKNFDSLPDASQYSGKKVKNDETGEVFISDGKKWKKFNG